tara:strand:- start:4779 stop:5612 length:834 start_codon:yes stop_codon:yes gene_type:complete
MSEEQVAEVSEDAQVDAPEVTQSVEDWRGSIPEEIRGHKSLQHINDVGALAKSYVHAQSMIGADKVAIPGKHATDEDWSEVYRRLGAPESAEQYNIVHNIPEGEQTDQGMVDWFASAAHAAGLNQMQAQKLADQWNDMAAQGAQSDVVDYEAYVNDVEKELRSEYGQAFDDKLNLGNGVVSEFGDLDVLELQMADGSYLGDNPNVIRLLANIGSFMQEKMGEDTLEGVKLSGGLTPEQARDKVSELTADGSPYWNARHPEHDWYVQEAMKFREILNV